MGEQIVLDVGLYASAAAPQGLLQSPAAVPAAVALNRSDQAAARALAHDL